MKKARLFDPDFRYVPACDTDISKTFARARRDLARQREAEPKVVQITKPRKSKERKKP